MIEIASSEQLQVWLSDKPLGWAQGIAERAALRVLPIASRGVSLGIGSPHYILALARTHFLIWGGLSHAVQDLEVVQDAIGRAVSRLAGFGHSIGTVVPPLKTGYQTPPPKSHAISARSSAEKAAKNSTISCAAALRIGKDAAEHLSDACDAVDQAATSIKLAFDAVRLEAMGQNWVYDGAGDLMGKHVPNKPEPSADASANRVADFWTAISFDAAWLAEHREDETAFSSLMHLPLWPGDGLSSAPRSSQLLIAPLLGIEPAAEWYELRRDGHHTGFNILEGSAGTEDRAILARLTEATDEQFWNKGPDFVEAQLRQWLQSNDDEAFESDAGNETNDENGAQGLALPEQNPNALQFARNEKGKIVLATAAGVQELKTDQDARARHRSAVEQATELLQRCQGSNAAGRLCSLLANYLAAAGANIEEMQPSLVVQRGERLRQELLAYSEADTTLPPIADDQKIDLQSLCMSHNMMVGLDPALTIRDTAMLGPDRRQSGIPPSEIVSFVQAADAADILDKGVASLVIEAAELAPKTPESTNRRTVWSSETIRNLVIEILALALNNPKKTGAVLVVGALAGVQAAGYAFATFKAAEVAIKHRLWIEERLCNTPTLRALFCQICNIIETTTPLGTKSTEKEMK